jgi:tetratricopeptide (TPR) repeat protein
MPRPRPGERLKKHVEAGQAAFAAGRLDEAVSEWSAALRSAVRLPASEALQMTLRNNLAGVHHALGHHVKARRIYDQALAAAERQHGPESQPVATILNNLAELERSSGRADHAEPLFRRAVGILEKRPDVARPQLASVLANTAECLRAQGDLDEAADLNARALSILESSSTVAPGPTGVLLSNMAQIHVQRGQYREAEALCERATSLLGQAGAAFDVQRRTAFANYALILRQHATAIERSLDTATTARA